MWLRKAHFIAGKKAEIQLFNKLISKEEKLVKKHETVRPMTPGQKKDLAKTAYEAVPCEMSFDNADAILANKGPLVVELRSVYEKYTPSSLMNRQLEAWRKIYRDYFGIELGPVAVPVHRKGFDRLIVVAQGVTIEQAYNVCARLFPCCKSYSNLDKTIPTNNRMPTDGAYVIWVRDRIEADEELKKLSANELSDQGILSETVMERELHEVAYFLETGKHLDLKHVSLLSGSRSVYGDVPDAQWNDGKFTILANWYDPNGSCDNLRARQVVS